MGLNPGYLLKSFLLYMTENFNFVSEKRDLIEDIASSILNGSSNRGLGGGGMNNETVNQSLTSSLLKSQYLSMVASMKTPNKPNVSVSSAKKKAKLPR